MASPPAKRQHAGRIGRCRHPSTSRSRQPASSVVWRLRPTSSAQRLSTAAALRRRHWPAAPAGTRVCHCRNCQAESPSASCSATPSQSPPRSKRGQPGDGRVLVRPVERADRQGDFEPDRRIIVGRAAFMIREPQFVCNSDAVFRRRRRLSRPAIGPARRTACRRTCGIGVGQRPELRFSASSMRAQAGESPQGLRRETGRRPGGGQQAIRSIRRRSRMAARPSRSTSNRWAVSRRQPLSLANALTSSAGGA